MELAVKGNKFAELTDAKDDKTATAKLTGLGWIRHPSCLCAHALDMLADIAV